MARVRVQAPQDLVAGASLLAVAAFALWASADVPVGHLRSLGPGMLPRVLNTLIALGGAILVVVSFLRPGESLGRWPWRGPTFIVLATVTFALTIRSVGLAVAGPLVVLISGAASPETRWRELVVFAAAITLFCVGLFRLLLHLPIPILKIPGVLTV
ncbi:MAG TPA: tripartite tricarboxylate transporter TctB family protein [Myxococcaceae bacterium]|nr:tripartite tricarboxylate transporter TctB family protein [Myxococcaceae bacterium]